MTGRETIFIVEDDDGICDVYEGALGDAYDVRIFGDGAAFFEAFDRERPMLVVLDIMLPDMDGYAILSRIRERDERIPVLIVSARSDEYSAIKGLNKGADDYITKPFSIADLTARVKAGLRRARLYVTKQADFVVDNGNYRILFRDRDLKLTLKEFRILRLLLSRAGTAVTREELFLDAWGDDFAGESRALDMHVAEIREKLRQAGAFDRIETVRGVGYRVSENL